MRSTTILWMLLSLSALATGTSLGSESGSNSVLTDSHANSDSTILSPTEDVESASPKNTGQAKSSNTTDYFKRFRESSWAYAVISCTFVVGVALFVASSVKNSWIFKTVSALFVTSAVSGAAYLATTSQKGTDVHEMKKAPSFAETASAETDIQASPTPLVAKVKAE